MWRFHSWVQEQQNKTEPSHMDALNASSQMWRNDICSQSLARQRMVKHELAKYTQTSAKHGKDGENKQLDIMNTFSKNIFLWLKTYAFP